MVTVRKNISITRKQDAFLKLNSISLSKLTQKAINRQIDNIKFAKVTEKNLREMEQGVYEEIDDFLDKAKK